ncbi:MAG: signal peptide peptidase SppA [Rhodothermaceae bacterium]|nr:signal peptide peptidase SppA [Rhodothermaceae bacterium]MYG69019.1 signal peptide peptidase SppA [Rhodothermaceae bacterium]MYJ45859.1 signal peptide peptidase SppA [Rhodothermaceae bacterium]
MKPAGCRPIHVRSPYDATACRLLRTLYSTYSNPMRFFSTLIASVLGSLIAVGVLIFLGSLIMAGIIASAVSTSEAPISSESVLVLQLSGPIQESGTADPIYDLFDMPQPQSLNQIRTALESAATDERIEAVWLKPQGAIAGWPTLLEIRQSLLEFKESGKPIVASASGDFAMRESDYFLASVADSIYASPRAFFEFNGFYLGVSFYKGLLDKLNIEPTVLRVGSYKGGIEPYTRENLSSENRAQLTAVLENWNELMVRTIAQARDLSTEAVANLMGAGELLTTEDAHAAGLLDGLLQSEEVESRIGELTGMEGRLKTSSLSRYAPSMPRSSSSHDSTIGIIHASGTIMSGSSSDLSGILGSVSFQRDMKDFREDDDVKAVVLRIDSPGGSATASESMWQAVRETTKKKPVVISMGDLAASGGYWLATAGDTIVASPHTVTGSIGVYGMHFSIGQMLETKLGITSDHVATSDYADMFSGMRPLRPSERALFERSLNETYSTFLERVSENRDMSIEAVHEVAQGRIWTGEAALEAGLIDKLGNLDDAIALAAEMANLEEDAYRIKQLPVPETLMDQYLELFLARIKSFVESPIETQLRTEARLIEEAAQLQGTPIARLPLDIEGYD